MNKYNEKKAAITAALDRIGTLPANADVNVGWRTLDTLDSMTRQLAHLEQWLRDLSQPE